MSHQIEVTRIIAATPEQVYALVSDLPASTGRSLTECAPTTHTGGKADSPGTGTATEAGRVMSS